MSHVALAATLEVVLASHVLLQWLLQVATLILMLELLEVIVALGQLLVEVFINFAPLLVADVELGLRVIVFLTRLYMLTCTLLAQNLCLRFDDLFVAVARILVQELARLVYITTALILDKFHEEAIRRVWVMAATAVILVFGHGSYQILCLLKCSLDRVLIDEGLDELLVELEGASLSDLICRVDSNNCRRWLDTFHQDLAEPFGVTRAQNHNINV